MSIGNTAYHHVLFKFKNIKYKEKPHINGKLRIYKSGLIKLGKQVKINSGARYNPIGGDLRTVFSVNKGASLEIGDFTGISNTAIVCRNHIKIGDYVRIGGGTKIYDTDFHSLDYLQRCDKTKDIPVSKPVVIKDYAFIGAHSIILKGVTIGTKSIIGASSVVTKSVPDGEIWAGNPARFIKKI
ncbi:MAG: acyltransferase [Bacteroidota bacterium]